MNLRQYNRTCKMLSDEIPVPKISSVSVEPFKRADTFTLKAKTLAEIANSNNIPFVRLYEAFLRYEDITVALLEIKKADLERKMVNKYAEVVDLSMGGDILAYKAYFSYLKEREYISRKIYSNNNETTDGIYLTEEEFEKLLLIDARRFDDMQFLITPEERNFIQTLRNRIVHGELSLTNYEIFNLLSILSTHRLTVHENTQLFMKLVENDKKKGLTDSSEDILQNGEDPFAFYTKNGADANANTSHQKTTYLFSGTGNLEKNIEYLLDFVQSPYFTDENVEKEKGIIEQEIKMYDDIPYWKLYDSTLNNAFHVHPLKYPIAGTVETINKITKADLYTCYNTFYHPSNMFLTIVGNFEPEQIIKTIHSNQKKKKYKKAKDIIVKTYEEPDTVAVENAIVPFDVEIPKVTLSYKINIGKLFLMKM